MKNLFYIHVFLGLVMAINNSDLKNSSIEFLSEIILLNFNNQKSSSNITKKLSCDRCKSQLEIIQAYNETQLSIILNKVFIQICPKFCKKRICSGVKETYVDTFLAHFFNHDLNPNDVCAKLKVCEQTHKKADVQDYIKNTLKDTLSGQQKQEWTLKGQLKVKSTENFKVLHLADLHIDLEYTEGANAFCDEPFCCRPESGTPKNSSQSAEYWGTLAQCDIPLRTLENMIQFISENIDVDMVVWTSDNISHDVWHQSQSNQTVPTRVITKMMVDKLKGVQIYPIFGNHEAYPADQFDMFGNNTQWLKDEVADMWTGVLSATEIKQIRKQGFYSSHNDEHNLKLIALNTQACDFLNFYLLDQITDPGNELEWLKQELKQAEDNNQFAYIFAHIPPGSTYCSSQWAERYSIIVERYVHVIKGQFFGHTHWDQIQTIKSRLDGRPLSTLFIAPSGTTWSYLNPSFRIFEMNGTDNSILDYTQYRLNLTKANQDGPLAKLQWTPVYNFVSQYGLKSASNPVHVIELASILENNKKLLKQYISNFYAGSKYLVKKSFMELNSQSFGTAEKNFYLCGIRNSIFDDQYECVGQLYQGKNHEFLDFKFLENIEGYWEEKQ